MQPACSCPRWAARARAAGCRHATCSAMVRQGPCTHGGIFGGHRQLRRGRPPLHPACLAGRHPPRPPHLLLQLGSLLDDVPAVRLKLRRLGLCGVLLRRQRREVRLERPLRQRRARARTGGGTFHSTKHVPMVLLGRRGSPGPVLCSAVQSSKAPCASLEAIARTGTYMYTYKLRCKKPCAPCTASRGRMAHLRTHGKAVTT